MTRRLSVVGLGPGRADWCLPAAADRLATATDLVGYGPYLDLIAVPTVGRRHPSGNRVEADRAAFALDLAAGGADVAVVSSGDPGIFAMAAAVFEQVELDPPRWSGIDIEVIPGVTAAQAAAARIGAPLGHDFCTISLSDVLKPWEVVERRIEAAAGADFVLAFYNPISRHRPWQLGRALEIVRCHRDGATPVVVARQVGRPDEEVQVVELGHLAPDDVDMRTVLVIGSSTTRTVAVNGREVVYTPRRYSGSFDPAVVVPAVVGRPAI